MGNDSPPSEPFVAEPVESAPAPTRWRTSLIVAAVVGTVALVLVVIAFWRQRPTQPIPQLDLRGVDHEIAEAITRRREALVNAPNSADEWGHFAMTLHAHGYRADALTCYAAASTLDPTNAWWPYLQGALLAMGSDPTQGVALLERAAELSPPNSVPRLALAETLMDLGQLDLSQAHFRQVLAASPADSRAQLGLAQLLVARKEYQEALPLLTELAGNPHAGKRSTALQVTIHTRRNDLEAADRLRQQTARMPDDAPWPDTAMEYLRGLQVGLCARLEQAAALLQVGRVSDVIDLLEETVERYPESDQALASLGKALIFSKRFPAADRALQRSLAKAPGNADTWYHVGLSRQLQTRHKEAIEAFREVLRIRAKDAQTYLMLGISLYEVGDANSAANAFREAVRLRPDLDDARQRLARIEKKS